MMPTHTCCKTIFSNYIKRRPLHSEINKDYSERVLTQRLVKMNLPIPFTA